MVRASATVGLECAVISFDGWRPRAAPGHTPAGALADPYIIYDEGVVRISRIANPAGLGAAGGFAAEFRPHLLHVHHSMLWPFAEELCERLAVPAVFTVHVLQREQNRLRGVSGDTLSSAAQDRALARADRIIAPSRAVAEILLRDIPSLRSRLRIIPLGIDDCEFARQAAQRTAQHSTPHSASARARPPVHRFDGPVLYAGRFSDLNGTADLFAAIPRIAEEVPSARFVVAGGIPENQKAEARWHRRLQRTMSHEVRERVHFPGWLAPAALVAHYRDAAVLLSPSRFETFGLVVLEAMLHGVPISATSAGGVADLITHEHTGLLAEPGDVQGIVGNTVTLLEQPAKAAALAQAAARTARSRLLWSRVIGNLTNVYRETQTAGKKRF